MFKTLTRGYIENFVVTRESPLGVVSHGFGREYSTRGLQEAVARALSLVPNDVESRWIDASVRGAGPSTLLDPVQFVEASVNRCEAQANGMFLGSWSVIVVPKVAPVGMMLAFAREIERRTGNAPGVVVAEQMGGDGPWEGEHVSDLPLRVRCQVGETLVVIRNIWVHHTAPYLVRGSHVRIRALDGPATQPYSHCVEVVREEAEEEDDGEEPERILLPWCLLVTEEEWADGAYPNGELGQVPPRFYPPLIPFVQYTLVPGEQAHFWYDWPAVRPMEVRLAQGAWTTVRFAW